MIAQRALAARSLASIAGALGDEPRRARWAAEHDALARLINERLWHEGAGPYSDLTRAGALARVKHIGTFWPPLAGVVPPERVARLVAQLSDESTFRRPHLFPSLAASEPAFVPGGNYWRGGVWAPTNYVTIEGLWRAGEGALAREASESHIDHVARAFATPPTDEARIAPDERDREYRTIWECYSSEAATPATRWDNTYYSRHDFVGWSGLGPIALRLEHAIGLHVDAAAGRVTGSAARAARDGVRHLPWGADGRVDPVAEPRANASEPLTVRATSDAPFTLEVRRPGRPPATVGVCAGETTFTVP
jgi:hypothetical protein